MIHAQVLVLVYGLPQHLRLAQWFDLKEQHRHEREEVVERADLCRHVALAHQSHESIATGRMHGLPMIHVQVVVVVYGLPQHLRLAQWSHLLEQHRHVRGTSREG